MPQISAKFYDYLVCLFLRAGSQPRSSVRHSATIRGMESEWCSTLDSNFRKALSRKFANYDIYRLKGHGNTGYRGQATQIRGRRWPPRSFCVLRGQQARSSIVPLHSCLTPSLLVMYINQLILFRSSAFWGYPNPLQTRTS